MDWLPNFPYKEWVEPDEGSFTCQVNQNTNKIKLLVHLQDTKAVINWTAGIMYPSKTNTLSCKSIEYWRIAKNYNNMNDIKI